MSGPTGGEEALGREAAERPRAGTAAVVAGVATLVGTLLFNLVLRSGPRTGVVGVLDALAARGGGPPAGESLTVRQVDYAGGRVVPLIASAVLLALGVALGAYALRYLFLAVRARRPGITRAGIVAAVVAGVLYPVGHLVTEVGRWTGAAGFADARVRTAEAARDAIASPTTAAGAVFEGLGTLALAVALVVISLNAIQVGLLTRVLGALGIFAGVLVVVPIDQGIIRAFWFVALGLVVLGRAPGGTPPAWRTGKAEPWPSQQQLREQREREREREGGGDDDAGGGGDAGPAPREREPASVALGAETAGQRRKRKRRR